MSAPGLTLAAHPNSSPLWVAVVLAVLGAGCYAIGARLQNRAIHTGDGQRLRMADFRRLLHRRGWLLGLLMLTVGTGLHVLALALAPITVVQPLGVLALPLTALLDACARRAVPQRRTVLAVAAATVGVGLFVVVAAGTSRPAAGTPDDVEQILTLLAAAIGVLTVLSVAVRRFRGLIQTAAAGTCFGFVAVLIKLLLVHLVTGNVAAVTPLAAPALLVALLLGGWYAAQAHASAPTQVVVAGLTVIDPLIAVIVGVVVLGEAAGAGPSTVAALLGCGLCAGIGVLSLARHRPTVSGRAAPADGAGPLRILLAADTFPPDINGAARFTQRLAAGLAARGHEVHVLCPAPAPGSEWAGLPPGPAGNPVVVHRIASHAVGVHPTFRVCLPWRLTRPVATAIDSIAPHVVHVQSHFLVGRGTAAIAARRGIPVIATNHFMPENLVGFLRVPAFLHAGIARLAWRDLHRVYSVAHTVTTPTPRAAELLLATGFPGPVVPVSCGIDAARYERPATSAATPTVLFVGRLDAEKHVEELLVAVSLLPARLGARLEIIGDGSQRGRLEALADRLDLRDRVQFHGIASEEALLAGYARCDIFCMPGTAELQSLATLEAMAAGTPIVAADAMALPHLVRDGVNGWLFPPGDCARLADRLRQILDLPPAARAAMGAASRAMAAGHDIAATLQSFEELYRTAMEPSDAPQPVQS